jgi:hypothetical protein
MRSRHIGRDHLDHRAHCAVTARASMRSRRIGRDHRGQKERLVSQVLASIGSQRSCRDRNSPSGRRHASRYCFNEVEAYKAAIIEALRAAIYWRIWLQRGRCACHGHRSTFYQCRQFTENLAHPPPTQHKQSRVAQAVSLRRTALRTRAASLVGAILGAKMTKRLLELCHRRRSPPPLIGRHSTIALVDHRLELREVSPMHDLRQRINHAELSSPMIQVSVIHRLVQQ